MNKWITYGCIGVVALCVGGVVGRYTAPKDTKVIHTHSEKTVARTAWIKSVVYKDRTITKIKVRRIKVQQPNGTVTTTETDDTVIATDIELDSQDKVAETIITEEADSQSKTTTTKRANWGLQVDWSLLPEPQPVPSHVTLQRRVWGPAWLTVGASQHGDHWAVTGGIRGEW